MRSSCALLFCAQIAARFIALVPYSLPKPSETPPAYGRSGLSVTSREEGLATESGSDRWDASRAPGDSRPSWTHGGADGGVTATSDAHESDSYRYESTPPPAPAPVP